MKDIYPMKFVTQEVTLSCSDLLPNQRVFLNQRSLQSSFEISKDRFRSCEVYLPIKGSS